MGFKIVSSMAYGNTSVGASAVSLVAARSGRSSVIVQNNHATQDLYIGNDANVTTSNGLHLKAGASLTLDDYNGAVFAIASGASTDVRTIETF